MNRNVISLDLAKNVIQIAHISKHGELLFNRAASPKKVKEILAKAKPAIVAMEGCGSCQYWARLAQSHGHEARIMQARKVKPYVSGQKTDANDAIGIAIAATQLSMRFCPVKTVEQSTLQAINTSRRHLDSSLTALNNHIRAMAYEFGVAFSKGQKGLREGVCKLLDVDSSPLPVPLQNSLTSLWQHYQDTRKRLAEVETQLLALTRQLEPCQRLKKLEGVGDKCAALLYAALGNGAEFKNGRAAAVYVGVTPKQHSSGGKTVLLGITKQGDKTLRAALYQGALSVISKLSNQPVTEKQRWLISLVNRAGIKRACIALVNKTIRTAWAMLRYNSEYQVALLKP
jgi:transposase